MKTAILEMLTTEMHMHALVDPLNAGNLLVRLPEFRELEKEAGRTVPISVFGVEHDADEWQAYEDAGIERIVLSMGSEQADAVLPKLDAWAKRL